MPAGPVILNSTPLIALFQLGHLEWLYALFGEVLVPPAVWNEFLAVDRDLRSSLLSSLPWLRRRALVAPERARVFIGLDRGEAEVLSLALELSARLVIMDERRGRRYAQRLDIPLTGTLGILLLAKEQAFIPAVAPSIAYLQEAGLFLDTKLVTKVLTMANES